MKYLPIIVLGFLFLLTTYVVLWFSVFDLTVVRYNTIELSHETVRYDSGYSYDVVMSRNEPLSYKYRDWIPDIVIYRQYAWISSAFYPLHKISFLVNGVRSTEPTKDVRNISGIK
jgi:hypothetical protein